MLIWYLEYRLDTAEEAQNLFFSTRRMSDMCISGTQSGSSLSTDFSVLHSITTVRQSFPPKQ